MDKSSLEKIKILRYETKASILDCKNSFIKNKGNMDKAIKELRHNSILKGIRKSVRKASEGLICLQINNDNSFGILLEVNCETDFVVRNSEFNSFIVYLTKLSLINKLKTLNEVCMFNKDGISVEDMRLDLVSKYGENIRISRIKVFSGDCGSVFGYVHGDSNVGKLGSMLYLKGINNKLAYDLAMHIVAMNPLYLNRKSVPISIIEEKRELYIKDVFKKYGKKDSTVIDKIIKGKLEKDLNDIIFLNQKFVKSDKITVNDIIKDKLDIIDFVRFDVGKEI